MTWSKASRQARGYGSDWDKLRLVILKRDRYLCQCDHCKGGAPGGRVLIANEVNHIVPKVKARAMGWTDEQIDADSNLQAINSACHTRVTIEQSGGTYRGTKGCDVTGRPLDKFHHWNTGGASSRSTSDLPPDRIEPSCAEASIGGRKVP